MLRFFRSSQNTVITAIILIGILTWLHVFVAPGISVSDKYGTFMFKAFSAWLMNMSVLQNIFGMILFLLAAVLLVFVNMRLRLIGKFSYMPALCYILLVGGVPEIHLFNPAIIATVLLISGFILLLDSFENDRLSYSYFTVPALISLSTFFYQYMYVYMLVVWLVIALWRPGYWREWVFSILGFALPLFFAFSWFFLVEDDAGRIGTFLYEIFIIQRNAPVLSISNIVFIALSIALAIIIFRHTIRYIGSKKTAVRTGYYVLLIIALITACMIIAVPDMLPLAWYLLAFPASLLISFYLANVKSKRWGNIILAILFCSVCFVIAVFITVNQ